MTTTIGLLAGLTAAVAVIVTNVATAVALVTLATFKARFARHPEESV